MQFRLRQRAACASLALVVVVSSTVARADGPAPQLTKRDAGFVLGAFGVSSLAAGSVAFVLAARRADHEQTDREAVHLRTAGITLIGVGAVGLAVASYLIVLGGHRDVPRAHAKVRVTPAYNRGPGFMVSGSF